MPLATSQTNILKTMHVSKLLTTLIFLLTITRSVYGQYEEFRICFSINSSQLQAEAESEIQKIVTLLKSPEFSYMKIFGYATTSGDEDYNTKLSKQRAYAVYNGINKLYEIDKSRFYMEWIGESADTYDFHYENAKPQSPCVDIIIQLEK